MTRKKGANTLNTTERQAHSAHQTFQKSCNAAQNDGAHVVNASISLDADSPEVVAQLETLDDAVFDAVQGKAVALSELRDLWPQLKSRLGDALLAESREQYIRYALSVWREPAFHDGDHDHRRAVNALEVLCILFDEL